MSPTALLSALVSSPWYVPRDTVSNIAMTKSEKAQNSRVLSETKFSSFSFVSLRIYDILAYYAAKSFAKKSKSESRSSPRLSPKY